MMDDDIDAGRKAIHDLLSGVERIAHGVTDVSEDLTSEEKAFQHEAVRGLRQLLSGLTDLGALAADAARRRE
ncbi:MAG: hypothetical protein L3K15_08370 [Thermoplasmata archaeon]|nr:hypothetical protein [Thermoplasmata archaeon]